MKILLTNDDAYFAPGLQELHAVLKKRWPVLVVAPDREQSATSHSLTLNQPLRINAVQQDVYSVEGTPADCVLLSLHTLLKKKPDLIISGINHGPNLGEDVIYSGTVAAAREGALLGIPSVAVSVTSWNACRFDYATAFMVRLIRAISRHGLPPGIFLNVNIPAIPPAQIRGAAVTILGKRRYKNVIRRRQDPRGKYYYWISGTPVWKREKGTDYQTVADNMVSVTPLTLDLTGYGVIEELNDMFHFN